MASQSEHHERSLHRPQPARPKVWTVDFTTADFDPPTPLEPVCCEEPMVLYRHVAWECMSAYSLLREEGVIADDGATPPTWIGRASQVALRERFVHLIATRLPVDEDDPLGERIREGGAA